MYFFNAKKMNCALMFINAIHYGRKCLSNLLQLEAWNDMFKVISGMLAHRYDMSNTLMIAINFCNATKFNYAFMFIISNHYG